MSKTRLKVKNYIRKKEKFTIIFLLLTFLSSSLVFLSENNTLKNQPEGLIDNFRKNDMVPNQAYIEIPDISNLTQLEDFLDYFIPFLLSELDTMGGVISVVKDDALLISKGYGFSDIERNKPVNPNSTLFRVGSVSKLFTWTAIMQLVEQEILDLDTDINEYLNAFQVPETFPEPITLNHLLTHTAGFEETYARIISDTDVYGSLEEELKNHLPPRVRPPGIMTSYSNYGTALAGFIIEESTGIKYEEYIEENILRVLDMNRSSFDQPLPLNLTEDTGIPTGFYYDSHQFYEGFFDYTNIAPAAGLSTTVDDMANFMMAHLNNGTLREHQILHNDTIQEMHSQQFITHPQFPSMCYGFHFYLNDSPVVAFEKLAWYDTNSFQLGFFILISSIFGLSIIYWLGKGIFGIVQEIKERKKRKERKTTNISKELLNQKETTKSDIQISNVFKEKNKPKITSSLPYWLVFAEILINVIFGLLFFPNLLTRLIPGYDFETSINKILIIPIIFIIMVIGTIIYAILGWFESKIDKSKRKWTLWDQIHYSIIVFAGIGWIWFLDYWNLIGLFSEGI